MRDRSVCEKNRDPLESNRLSVSIEPSIGVLGGLLPLKSGNCKNCPFRFHRVTMVGNPSSTSASQLKRIGEKSLACDNIVKSVGSVRNRNPENRCWEAEDERKPESVRAKGSKMTHKSHHQFIGGDIFRSVVSTSLFHFI